MSDIWGTLKGLITQIDYRKVYIDNNLFRLHYKVTAVLLVVFGILVTSRQYIGDPIDCITDEKAKPLIDQFCWVHGTYTKAKYVESKKSFAYAPIDKDPYNLNARNLEEWEKQFHNYYQWVWCFLFFQALLFYLPHWIWKTWEGGRLKTLVADLNTHVIAPDVKSGYKAAILEYLTPPEEGGTRGHNIYAYQYAFCELLNFVNILTQIFLIDAFLGYEFSTYGSEVLKISESKPFTRHDAMNRVFPIVTMCQIKIFGFAGSLNDHDALCVLPINILNEKIYIFIWFWFFILALLSGFGVCYRIATMFPNPEIKKFLMKRLNRSIDTSTLHSICTKSSYGDWFFLYRLGNNMNPIYFGELLRDLSRKLERQAESERGWDSKPPLMSDYDKMSTMDMP